MHLSDDCWKPHHVHILACGVDYCSSCCCSIITSVTHTVFLWEFPKWRTSVGMETKWWQAPYLRNATICSQEELWVFLSSSAPGTPLLPLLSSFSPAVLPAQPSSSTSVFISPSSQSVCWSLLRISAAHLPSLTPITLSLLFVLALDRWPVNLTLVVLGCGGVLHTHDCYFLYLSWEGGGCVSTQQLQERRKPNCIPYNSPHVIHNMLNAFEVTTHISQQPRLYSREFAVMVKRT